MSNSFDNFLKNIGDVTIEPTSKQRDPSENTEGAEKQQQSSSENASNDGKDMMDGCQSQRNDDCSAESNNESSGRTKKLAPVRTEDIEEIRAEGSNDDMDLDETIDSHIGVRMEGERQRASRLPSDEDEVEEEEEIEDDDIGIDTVNLLDSLPLEGAPIEGQEVSEADLLGTKIHDDDEDDGMDDSSSRSSRDKEVNKRQAEEEAAPSGADPAKKKHKKDDESGGTKEEGGKTDKKGNMRRNIRDVLDESQLDEVTLAAQRQEAERVRRVQEQQRIIREVQRRQSSNRGGGVSLLRSNQNVVDLTESQARLPSSVMLKVNSGPGASNQASIGPHVSIAPRRGRVGHSQGAQSSSTSSTTAATLQQRVRMMTPSVSISPVVPKKDESLEDDEPLEYYTDSDLTDLDADADEVGLDENAIKMAGAKPAKSKDVVTISSSSESSDDDCIVLSDPSEPEDSDNDDDPTNSGMHTNDRYNVPDDQGRVLVNVGHPDDEPDVFLAPQVARIIKPHQIGGIRFLFDNIVESIDRYKSSEGFGCILAHSMGLGKTLQVASFCDIFFRSTDAKTVLCIMPINTLQNWLAEFNMWLPYDDPNKPKVEEKPVIKEENSNQSDLSYMSRPGSEHDPMSQQRPPGIMPDPSNPYASYPGYNQIPPHYPPSGNMYDPRYGPSYPVPGGYSPVKTEPSCHPHQMNPGMHPYGMNSQGTPQYNMGYPPQQQQQQQPPPPPNMQYPQSMQPPPGMQQPGYPGMDMNSGMHPGAPPNVNPHAAQPTYPGYGASPQMPYPTYGNTIQPKQETPPIKTENPPPQEAKVEANQDAKTDSKTEVKDEEKKETEKTKKEGTEEKKETIKTPFSVDAPPDMQIRHRHFKLHILNDSHKTMNARARVIRDWQKVGGVLLIGYELYRQLSLKKPNKAKRKRNQPLKDPSMDVEEDDKNKPLLEEMQTALVEPGPDLVICDEGHRIKNSHASISLALKQMRTKRRIVLTGYPLQNNLLEYWCMVDFVRPNYLGTKSEFCNMFERPIQNGQCIDSTPQDIRLMRYRAHVLHDLLEGFVQRRSHSVLQVSLPRKEEYIMLVRMTAHQRKLYDTFMNQVVKTRAVPNPLKAFAVCCKIWNHPDVLYYFLKKREKANEEDDLDLEETMGDKGMGTPGKRFTKPRQPKGEGKRGRKPLLKNKPEASVQPNSSNTTSELSEADGQKQQQQQQQQPFQNFNAPALPPPPSPMSNNSGFQQPTPQNPYPQQQTQIQQQPPPQQQAQQPQQSQQAGYQNYRPDGNNYSGGEYNNFYGDQNQQSPQKYPASNNQNFQPYQQNQNYPPSNQPQQQQTQQQYQTQQQNYNMSLSDQGQRFPGPSTASQNQTTNFSQQNQQTKPPANSSSFPRPNYPYQGDNKNYPGNVNQNQNYMQTPNQQQQPGLQNQNQTSNQMAMPEYNSYQQTNSSQGYSNNATGQQVQNNSYPNSMPQNQNTGMQNTQSTGYMNNQQQQQNQPAPQGFPQNQQSGNTMMPNQMQQPYGAPMQQSNQNVPGVTNQSQPYAVNQSGAPSNMAYNQNQPHQQPNQQQFGYDQSNLQQQQQGQMQGYQNVPQNQTSNYPANQSQSMSYPNDQQQKNHQPQIPQQQSQYQQQPPMQQQSQIVPQQSQPMQNYQQQQGYNQQPNQGYAPPGQQPQSSMGYSANRSGVPPTPTTQMQTGYQPHTQQNQQGNYSQNQQMHTVKSEPQESYGQNVGGPMSQNSSQGYPSANPQMPAPNQMPPNNQMTGNPMNPVKNGTQDSYGQNVGGNYPMSQNPSHGYPPTNPQQPAPNQMSTNNQMTANQQQPQGQDQYWQKNYQNSSDPYYNNGSSSQYQGNQYPGGVATSENYQTSQPNQQNQYSNFSASTMIDQKLPPPPVAEQQVQNPAQTPSNSSQQNQQQAVQPLSNAGINTPQSNAINTAPGIASEVKKNETASAETAPKEEEKEKEDGSEKDKSLEKDKDKEEKSDDESILKDEEKEKSSPGAFSGSVGGSKEEPGIPYDWATEMMKNYVPGLIEASAKMQLFFCILEEAILLGDRVLTFSQSLFTLNLIEDFLARNNFKYADGKTEAWVKNVNYYRLDGSTSALEREKLINEFNANSKIHLFLVSTRAGSLGINLVGANRAIVFDASWNPCHDTQAVCRVYRYGQRKNCYVYRLVTDNCLERKIYDRQISKQGMSDRVVDQCNPDAHLSLKEATTLNWDWEEDGDVQDFSGAKDTFPDTIMHTVLEKYSSFLTKKPFHHESLLVDRKEKKLSQAEKRLARRGYELEKMAATTAKPSYNYVPGNTAPRVHVPPGGLQIRQIQRDNIVAPKPVASVRPMQQRGSEPSRTPGGNRWIPAEVWQRQGMSAQEMTLPLDVVIPTNSPDKGSIVLKAGQKVMVLKSPKGIYMQLESGKIIAIRTALKMNQQNKDEEKPKNSVTPTPHQTQPGVKGDVGFPLRNNSSVSIIPKTCTSVAPTIPPTRMRTGINYRPFGEKEVVNRRKTGVATATAKPYTRQPYTPPNQRPMPVSRMNNKQKPDIPHDLGSMGDSSNSSDGQRMRSDQRVEEVRMEDMVNDSGSNSDYSPSARPSSTDSMKLHRPMLDKPNPNYSVDSFHGRGQAMRPGGQERDFYSQDPKINAPRNPNLGRPLKDKKPNGSDGGVMDDATQHRYQQPHPHHHHQHQQQPQVHQPIPQHPQINRPRPISQASGVPRVTSDVIISGNKNLLSNPLPNHNVAPAPPSTPVVPTPKRSAKPTPVETSPAAPEPLPQGYPYAQYPRYYDYGDPRNRPLDPYSPYYPAGPPPMHSAPALPRATPEVSPAPPSIAQPKPVAQEPPKASNEPAAPTYSRSSSSKSRAQQQPESAPVAKPIADTTTKHGSATVATATPTLASREDVPTAFSHPASARSAYPGSYPPYDPYSQHYPPAPAASTAYAAGAAPGYPAYGGPSYSADYARPYSAFHGPPPPSPLDPYRGYAPPPPPPASHPSAYYPPFSHAPPPPYPNYSFLPSYPNPSVPADAQPPAP